MKNIVKILELGNEKDARPLRELIQLHPHAEKEKILRYLKSKKPLAYAASVARDLLTKKVIPGSLAAFSDGEFEWRSDEVYYFEKYNIKLEDEFVAHVLKNA